MITSLTLAALLQRHHTARDAGQRVSLYPKDSATYGTTEFAVFEGGQAGRDMLELLFPE
jgi:hypothetical protein